MDYAPILLVMGMLVLLVVVGLVLVAVGTHRQRPGLTIAGAVLVIPVALFLVLLMTAGG